MKRPRCEKKGTVAASCDQRAYVGLAIRSRYEVFLRRALQGC